MNAAREGIAEVDELVRLKSTRAEKAPLSGDEDARLSAGLDRVLASLEAAHASSPLPDETPNRAALDAWLVATRLAAG